MKTSLQSFLKNLPDSRIRFVKIKVSGQDCILGKSQSQDSISSREDHEYVAAEDLLIEEIEVGMERDHFTFHIGKRRNIGKVSADKLRS